MNAPTVEWSEARIEARTLFINAVLEEIAGTLEGERALAAWTRILEREMALVTDPEIRRTPPPDTAGAHVVEVARALCRRMGFDTEGVLAFNVGKNSVEFPVASVVSAMVV